MNHFRHLLVFFCLLMVLKVAIGQEVRIKNVNAEQNFNTIIIKYDIDGAYQDKKFMVKLFCSTNGGKAYGEPLIKVSGDIGYNIAGGEGKKIIWDVLSEVSEFSYNNVVFKVTAEPITHVVVDMIFIEGGEFLMGNNNGESDEKPAHHVTVSNFFISKTEITVAHYRDYCFQKGIQMPDKNITWIDDHPITYVSYYDAKAYCNWLSEITGETYRLPTEAEWEYAARGGVNQDFITLSGSDDINEVAWHRGNTGGYAHFKVGQLKPNSLNLYDLNGNVWEWCEDWYGLTYYAYSISVNPIGPPSGTKKVARGGSWRTPTEKVNNTFRFFMTPTARTNYVGFRVVREP